jgi:hypothetical protein
MSEEEQVQFSPLIRSILNQPDGTNVDINSAIKDSHGPQRLFKLPTSEKYKAKLYSLCKDFLVIRHDLEVIGITLSLKSSWEDLILSEPYIRRAIEVCEDKLIGDHDREAVGVMLWLDDALENGEIL